MNITKSSQKTSEKGPGISKWYLGTRLTPENAMRFAILALLNISMSLKLYRLLYNKIGNLGN